VSRHALAPAVFEFFAFESSKTVFDRFREEKPLEEKPLEKVTCEADARLIGTACMMDKVEVTWSGRGYGFKTDE